MKQSLQLKIGQSLTLTPQLQQAIKLLQLSTLDLQQAIEETLASNPLLERDEDQPEAAAEQDIDFSARAPVADDSHDLAIDTRWEDLMPSSAPPMSAGDGDRQFAERDAAPESLQSHLLWQLNTTRFSDIDYNIALAFIDAVDGNGRLTQTPEDILSSLALPEVELDEVMAVLHRLQHFEPTGIFATDLRECLLIQLRQLSEETPYRDIAGASVNRHLDQIATAEPRQLARRLRCTEVELRGALALIRSLDPMPGAAVGEQKTEYVVPDVFVRRVNGLWRVELNSDIAPKLRINSDYAGLLNKSGSESDKTYVKDNLQEARWFMKGLLNRNETLLKVSAKIVEHQRLFLEVGEEAMRPLVLAEIAEQIDMHESTISRATTKKYMHTPRGVFELKYFFSSHVATAEGGECSSTAIRALIKKLVLMESPKKPLSDSKLCALLKEQGVMVARRTVAKYREQLNIPPSNARKRLF